MNRVVAHSIPDSPSAFQGNGLSATSALWAFLSQRMRLRVYRGGVGFVAPQVAADEAWRNQARATVMAHIQRIDYVQTQIGPGLRVRLEVIVVRDGRMVLRRILDSPPTPAVPPSGFRRGREADPMFAAVSQALESLVGDLALSLADPR